jgi:phosphoesterase RecJ-like protein
MTSHEAAVWLQERDNFLVLTHLRPDGDTLGSAAALCQGLIEAGKTAYILENPQSTPKYLKYVAKYTAPDDFRPDYTVSVDCATREMLQVNAGPRADDVDLCIDHHKSNSFYAKETCVYGDRAACGEVVYDILISLSGKISPETALLLYFALSTDTGCFVYGNTNAAALRTAAALIEAGAPNMALNKEMHRTKRKSRVLLESLMISGMEYYRDGTIAVSSVTEDVLKETGADEDDCDDIASIPGQIEGVVVAVVLRELPGGEVKISVRTTSRADANKICALCGGGGHPMAAGCTLKASVAQAKEIILDCIHTAWPA